MMPVCLWKFRHLFYMHCLLAVALHVLLAMPAANWLLRHNPPIQTTPFIFCLWFSLFVFPFLLASALFYFPPAFCESIISIALGQAGWLCLSTLIEVYFKYVYKCQNVNYAANFWGRIAPRNTHAKTFWGLAGVKYSTIKINSSRLSNRIFIQPAEGGYYALDLHMYVNFTWSDLVIYTFLSRLA